MVMVGVKRRRRRGLGRPGSGWTLFEVLAVILITGVLVLVASLSAYRGKVMSEQVACHDNMRAIHSALQIYWERNSRTYPVDQAAFEQFLASPTYFAEGEPHCPQDENRSLHYIYGYTLRANPVPGDVVISCPVPRSGHGSL